MDLKELFFDINHPTLGSSCARATTRAETAFRVQYPNSSTRSSRIFALDPGAAEAMYAITEDPWNGAHFMTVALDRDVDPEATAADRLPLAHPDGSAASLEAELEGADLVVLLASGARREGAAEVIAREAFHRKIMCAGLALGSVAQDAEIDAVVNTMRRFASVLVVARDTDYIPAMLTALRA